MSKDEALALQAYLTEFLKRRSDELRQLSRADYQCPDS